MKNWQYWPLSVSMASAKSDPASWPDIYRIGGIPLARPNYNYEKRQKELAKQKKNEEKRLRKMEKRSGVTDEASTEPVTDEESTEPVAGDASNE